eukprot:2277523-Alexandrium_andersonii.AAC.1
MSLRRRLLRLIRQQEEDKSASAIPSSGQAAQAAAPCLAAAHPLPPQPRCCHWAVAGQEVKAGVERKGRPFLPFHCYLCPWP